MPIVANPLFVIFLKWLSDENQALQTSDADVKPSARFYPSICKEVIPLSPFGRVWE